jgi:hypothetical protein
MAARKTVPRALVAAEPDTVAPEERVEPPASPPCRWVARKPFTVNGRRVRPGDPVPEADEWIRYESWVRAGLIVERAA